VSGQEQEQAVHGNQDIGMGKDNEGAVLYYDFLDIYIMFLQFSNRMNCLLVLQQARLLVYLNFYVVLNLLLATNSLALPPLSPQPQRVPQPSHSVCPHKYHFVLQP
jgi:hypothetical protein